MKKIYSILTIACMAVLAAGCAKEALSKSEEKADSGQLKTYTVGVSLPAGKIGLDFQGEGIYKLIWSEGDCIVVNGVLSDPLTAEQAGKSSASFTVTGIIESPYNIVYCGKQGKDDAVVFPNCTIVNEAGLVQDFSTPLYASSDALDKIELHPLNAVLKITLTGESTDEIRSIAIQSAGTEMVSGEFTIGKTDGKLNGEISGGTVSATGVNVAATGAGVPLDATGKAFYACIPAGTYPQGFNAFAATVGGKTMKLTFGTASGITIAAGKVYEFKAKTFTPNTEDVYIATPADMVAFSNMSGTGYSSRKVHVINDIDMTGTSYTSVSFYGSFDGEGHTISGMTTALFNELYGNVKNLTIEANINYTTGGQAYGMGILAHYLKTSTGLTSFADGITTKGTLSLNCNWNHAFQAGGAVGASNGVKIVNCTNYADIIVEDMTVNDSASDKTDGNGYFGGVVGTFQSAAAETNNLVNYGRIVVEKANIKRNFGVGGVIGCHNVTSAISNFTNHGEIIIGNAATNANLYPGGCVGYVNKSATTLSNCVNNANISVGADVSVAGYLYYGGIAGYSFGKIDNCTNNGDLSFSGTVSNNATFGGIVGRTATGQSGVRVNAVNNGNITIPDDFSNTGKTFYLGGVVGHMQSGNITGENHGNITMGRATANLADCFIGGIVGMTDGNLAGTSSKKVINTGNISVNNLSSNNGPYIGGIVGYWYGENGAAGNNYSIAFAQNSGKLSYVRDNTSTTDLCKWFRVGGIVAYLSGYNVNNASKHFITDCTNSGDIYFEENLTAAAIAKNPTAGGIIAMSYGTKTDLKVVDITISNCNNTGNIDRLCNGTDDTKGKITESASTTVAIAGGIMGCNGAFTGGGSDYMYTKFDIENCSNSGNVRWNAWRTKGSRAEAGGEGTMCYTGGIIGFGWGYAEDQASQIICCNNSGILNSNYGKHGGIIGFARGYTTIAGKNEGNAITYCTNTGGVMYDSSADSYTASNCLSGYAGGIAGYIFGDGHTVFRYCYNNCGRTGGNYGAGGFVGQMCSSGSPTSPTIEYCKVNARSMASSTANAYGLFAGQAGGLDWSKVSNVAVGGAYKGSTATKFTMTTATNFTDYLVKNNSTQAMVDAAKAAAAAGRLVFWDGETKPAWEP